MFIYIKCFTSYFTFIVIVVKYFKCDILQKCITKISPVIVNLILKNLMVSHKSQVKK